MAFTKGSIFASSTEISSLVLNFVKSMYDWEIIFLKTVDEIVDPINVVTFKINLRTNNFNNVDIDMIIIKTTDIYPNGLLVNNLSEKIKYLYLKFS